MRSTYAIHQTLIETARMNAETERRARAIAVILAARAESRARQGRNARRAIIAAVVIFIAGLIFIPAPIL